MKIRTMNWNKTKSKAPIVLAAAFTGMQVIGWQLSMENHTSVHTSFLFQQIGVLPVWAALLVAAAEFFLWLFVIRKAFAWLDGPASAGKSATAATLQEERATTQQGEREATKQGESGGEIPRDDAAGSAKKKSLLRALLPWTAVLLALLLLWLPSYLAAYPGYYNYDASGQLAQAMYDEVPYNTHHPLLHTLLMGKIVTWGYHHFGEELSAGVVLYSLVQMGFSALCMTAVLRVIWTWTKNRILTVLSFLYYALFPVIPMFTFCFTKDVPCALATQFVLLGLYVWHKEGTEKFFAHWPKPAGLLLAMILMCMFRKNCVYALVVFAFFEVAASRRQLAVLKKTVLFYFLAIALYLGANMTLERMLAAEPGNPVEAFCMPIQQISRVYNEEGEAAFSAEDLERIYACIGAEGLENYNPQQADYIKNWVNFDPVRADKAGYLGMWVRTGLAHPLTYLESLLQNTYQLWYPGTSVMDNGKENPYVYFSTHLKKGCDPDPQISWIYEMHVRIGADYFYQKIPVVRLLFSMGFLLWGCLFLLGWGISRKRRAIWSPMLLVALTCGTVMLGPIMLIRYVLILFYGFPIAAAMVIREKKEWNTTA